MTGSRNPLKPERICPSDGSIRNLMASTSPIYTPLTLTAAPNFDPVEVAGEHADEADRLREYLARADQHERHDQDGKTRYHERADNRRTYLLPMGCPLKLAHKAPLATVYPKRRCRSKCPTQTSGLQTCTLTWQLGVGRNRVDEAHRNCYLLRAAIAVVGLRAL
jgi:hypothetical protein